MREKCGVFFLFFLGVLTGIIANIGAYLYWSYQDQTDVSRIEGGSALALANQVAELKVKLAEADRQHHTRCPALHVSPEQRWTLGLVNGSRTRPSCGMKTDRRAEKTTNITMCTPPKDIFEKKWHIRGTSVPLCPWYQRGRSGAVLFPRGPQRGYKREFVEQAHGAFLDATQGKAIRRLSGGSLLGTIVGGDWSHDNDVDFLSEGPSDVCVCLYGCKEALCPRWKNYIGRMQGWHGYTWWMLLPRLKRMAMDLIQPVMPHENRPDVEVLPPVWYHWWGEMFNPAYRTVDGETILQNGRWHDWRWHNIIALADWDWDGDGELSVEDVVRCSLVSANREWMLAQDPCVLYNAAVHANSHLHYLRVLEIMYRAGANMTIMGPEVMLRLPVAHGDVCQEFVTIMKRLDD